jgi:hypothetical protein
MKQFPSNLKPNNRIVFPQMKFNLLLEQWRIKCMNYILKNEKNGFDLCDENNIIDKRIIDCLRLELSVLGWKTALAYNGTILFIYENENELEKYKYALCEELL